MVQIERFAVEEWMDQYQLEAKHDIAETCCASISLEQLQDLCEDKTKKPLDFPGKLTYGAIRGSDRLRSNLARLYSSKTASPLPPDNVLITQGAIAANYLVYYSLVGRGDHLICHFPTYQQLYAVPASLGAEIDLWEARPENNWIPDIEELKSLIKPNTKMIVINNPNNPTGAVLKRSLLQNVVDLAAEKDIILFADEVYRPIFHSISPADQEFPPSVLSLGYKKTIATGSVSKAYSLAGIRVGWIASRDRDIIEELAAVRHYTAISVSQIDDQVATYALDPNTVHNLLGRNLQLAKKNLDLMEKFVIKHDDVCSWVKPLAGTTAFVKFTRDGKAVDSQELCRRLFDKVGVLVLPGDSCFGQQFKGYVRIGYVQETDDLVAGLDAFKTFLRKEFDDVPLAKE